jgi:hypothetical protein
MIRLARYQSTTDWLRRAFEFAAGAWCEPDLAIHLEGTMMSKMSLKMKLGVGFGTLLVILALMGWWGTGQ